MKTLGEARYSSKIIKAGALLPDTKLLLENWDEDLDVQANLDRIRQENLFGKASRSRIEDILLVFRQRYLKDPGVLKALVVMARSGVPSESLDRVLYFQAARSDRLLHDLVTELFYERSGRSDREVRPWGVQNWVEEQVEAGRIERPWSEAVQRRVAQGLLASLRDFGILEGSVNKRLAFPYLTIEAFAFLAFQLYLDGSSGERLVNDPEWRLFLLPDGTVELPAEASMVFLGNLNEPPERLVRKGHLFVNLPDAMIDAAFLDRMHFYLPGWDAPKMEQRFFSDHYGFISDYLAEALRTSRRQNYSGAVDEEFAFGEHLNARDERAVRKTVSGLLKILHPHGEWSRAELREYLELALEGRRRIKEQLKKLAPHEYGKTAFSYIERDTGMEFWVEVPEQPDTTVEETIDAERLESPATQESQHAAEPKRLSVKELMARGESRTVEFKSTARWHLYKGDKDPAIEREIVKAVAGFMNARGGTLLIGVNDERVPVGLENDYKVTGKRNRDPRDSFENWLTDLFDEAIGKPAMANMSVTFEEVDGHDVCRIDVDSSRTPVYAKFKQSKDFFVRSNNSTRSFDVEEAMDYIASHYHDR